MVIRIVPKVLFAFFSAILVMIAVQCRPKTLGDIVQERAEIAALVDKHNAVTDWSTLLPERAHKREYGYAFSIEIDEAINGDRDTAVLFIASLFDVRNTDSGLTAAFDFDGVSDISPLPEIYPSYLKLRCDATMANYLLENSIESGGSFALVVKLTGYNFPGYELECWYEPDLEDDIISYYQSDFFMLRGTILEATYIKEL